MDFSSNKIVLNVDCSSAWRQGPLLIRVIDMSYILLCEKATIKKPIA